MTNDAPHNNLGTGKSPLLTGLGQRVKLLRARRAMPRRVLAQAADVSERHLANLESGTGNVSILVLEQIAKALHCSLAELLGDETTTSPEWLRIRNILHGRSEDELQQARDTLASLFGGGPVFGRRSERIAFIGLRGAGKSTLGNMVAAELNRPFVELHKVVIRLAGAGPSEIRALYGADTFQRYERQALEETLHNHRSCVIATAGGLVADITTLELLLTHCFTIWLQADPEDHLNRVIAQGDIRQMTDRRKALDDLRLVLESRSAYYAKADFAYNTSNKTLDTAFAGLMAAIAERVEGVK
jgi:XRE family transcriptional regulator, aerobic/anaerobic benzoate catabolism transcriptional regulator